MDQNPHIGQRTEGSCMACGKTGEILLYSKDEIIVDGQKVASGQFWACEPCWRRKADTPKTYWD